MKEQKCLCVVNFSVWMTYEDAVVVHQATEIDDLDGDDRLCCLHFFEAGLENVELVRDDHQPWRICECVLVSHLSYSPGVDHDLPNEIWVVEAAAETRQMRRSMILSMKMKRRRRRMKTMTTNLNKQII